MADITDVVDEEDIPVYEHDAECTKEGLENAPGISGVEHCKDCDGYFDETTKKGLSLWDKRINP